MRCCYQSSTERFCIGFKGQTIPEGGTDPHLPNVAIKRQTQSSCKGFVYNHVEILDELFIQFGNEAIADVNTKSAPATVRHHGFPF